jgi:hypothetical protein
MVTIIRTPVCTSIFFRIIVIFLGLVLTGCTGNVIESYQREFGLDIPNPATGPWPLGFIFKRNCTQEDFGYNEDLGVVVGTIKEGAGHWTTTAYLPTGVSGQRHLYVMHLNLCGTELQETWDGNIMYERLVSPIPAGTFSVLTVVLTYPATTDSDTITDLTVAQDAINQQHATFASDQGYSSPLVHFNFTNEMVSSARLHINKDTPKARVVDALGRRGIDVDGYDILVVMNPDPDGTEGGISDPGTPAPYYIYVNTRPTLLTQADLTAIAETAYHHELGHYWGWKHDWTCAYDGPFITDPSLFGWTDTDDDGVAEIIDSTPYGRVP